MSLPVPLEVRLKTARTDRIITADLRDLTFRSVDPGGYASATASFYRPLLLRPDELDYFANLYIYDGRTATVVWEGWVEDLGGSVNDQGQIWSFAGVGPSGHVKDRQFPYIVADSALDKFSPTSTNQWNVSWGSGAEDEATGAPAIIAQLSNGSWVLAGVVAESMYRQIADAGMKNARIEIGYASGLIATIHWNVNIYSWTTPTTGAGGVATALLNGGVGAGGTLTAKLTGDGGSIVLGDNALSLDVVWDGPTNYVNPAAGEALWWTWDSFFVRTALFDKLGVERTSGYTTHNVFADEVVADLIGRGMLNLYDGAGATITAGTFGITQMAYPDSVTPEGVINDLLKLEPAFTWHAWESNAAGKYRFEWIPYPTTVGYEADVIDGYSAENTIEDVYNSVRVRYSDTNGSIRTVVRTRAVTALTNAGRTREAFVDLGDEVAITKAAANQAGDNFLIDHALPSNAGTLRIARRVLDVDAGRMVSPWGIKPGRLIRVAGIQPRLDALNPTGRDGVTVFRIKSVDVSAADGSASLNLDVYSRTTAQALAALTTLGRSSRRRR